MQKNAARRQQRSIPTLAPVKRPPTVSRAKVALYIQAKIRHVYGVYMLIARQFFKRYGDVVRARPLELNPATIAAQEIFTTMLSKNANDQRQGGSLIRFLDCTAPSSMWRNALRVLLVEDEELMGSAVMDGLQQAG